MIKILNYRKIILLGFALSGSAALIYEVAWTRSLQLVLGTTVYAVSTMLTAFMAGLAIGAWIIGRYADRIKNLPLAFCLIEAGIGIYGVLIIFIFNALPYLFLNIYHTFHVSFSAFGFLQFLVCFGVMLIPTMLMGGTFPIVSKIYAKEMEKLGRDIGTTYSVDTLGAVLGSFAAGFALIPLIGLRNTIMFAALINIFVSIFVFTFFRIKRKLVIASIVLLFALSTLTVPGYDEKALNLGLYQRASSFESEEDFRNVIGDMKLLYCEDGLYGTVSVTEHGPDGLRCLRINGKPDASTAIYDMPTQLLLGYVPLFLHDQPESVLNIGLGGGFTLGAISNFEVKKIDVVEIDELVIEAEKYFSDYNGNVLEDERVNVILADARNYLFLSDEKYDVIISEPSDPWISGSCSNLFTKEFFELAREHLNEDGIFVQWIPSYGISFSDFRILLNTFVQEYDYTTFWTSGDILFLGSESPMEVDGTRLDNFFSNVEIFRDMEGIGIENADAFLSRFIMNDYKARRLAQGASINTDDKPILEFSIPISMLTGVSEDIIQKIVQYTG